MSEFQKKILQRLSEQDAFMNLQEESDQFDPSTLHEQAETSVQKEPVYTDKWSEYFDKNEIFTDLNGTRFNTYYTPPKNTDNSPIFIFHHGAGSSGLTFSFLAKAMIQIMQKEYKHKESRKTNFESESIAGVFTFDARGHGKTVVSQIPINYSLESFTEDLEFIINELISRNGWTAASHPSIFLVGHSLGGSVMTNYLTKKLNKFPVKGLIMFDIVEETAVQALTSMHYFLDKRPKSFPSYKEAIKWHTANNIPSNEQTAELTIPDLLTVGPSNRLEWVANLYDTEPYWDTWFKNLSNNFVNSPTSKLLILAGSDKLDKNLMIGQMQGKYQLVVFNDSGHFIQEDAPQKTAITLIDFYKRNDRDLLKELNIPKWGGNINK